MRGSFLAVAAAGHRSRSMITWSDWTNRTRTCLVTTHATVPVPNPRHRHEYGRRSLRTAAEFHRMSTLSAPAWHKALAVGRLTRVPRVAPETVDWSVNGTPRPDAGHLISSNLESHWSRLSGTWCPLFAEVHLESPASSRGASRTGKVQGAER